LLLYVQV